jgi:hypothetical protein
MQAITTRYRGYRFRSRLEARWAVFYDALDIPFQYEPEGFDLGDGVLYLPDFWLPVQDCWIEIKPGHPTEDERDKAQRLAIQSGKFVFIFRGDVWPITMTQATDVIEPDIRNGALYFAPDGDRDGMMAWGHCPQCKHFVIGHCGASHAVSYREATDRLVPYSDCAGRFDLEAWHSPALAKAYLAARSARFEHGEGL